MVRLLTSALLAALSVSAVLADNVACGPGKQCPDSLPCCSQYGQCGVGAYCLGGCDPLFSHSLDSCVPAPTCKSQDFKFTSLDGITSNTKYLGDASKTNWVASGQPLAYNNQVLLTMAPDSVGTLLASASYVWYGKISATMKSSRGTGVVTAFILLSDVKDEIDYEFVGVELDNAQSNYYSQGITNYQNEQNISLSDTFQNYHTYEIDWTPEQITWSVDGEVKRTKKKSETWNSTANRYDYPQTPARIQLSLWPAGLSSNAKGTIEWGGGLVDWNSQDIKNNGYYYATIKEVNVQCYDPPSGAKSSGSTSYIYTAQAGTNDTVQITNKPTILKSLLGTGTNMSADYPSPVSSASASSSGSKTASSSAAASSTEVATVPGLTGAGPGSDGQRGASGNTNSGSGSGSGSGSNSAASSGVSSASGSAATGVGGFSQGNGNGGSGATTKGNGASSKNENVLQGSITALLVAIVGMLAM